ACVPQGVPCGGAARCGGWYLYSTIAVQDGAREDGPPEGNAMAVNRERVQAIFLAAVEQDTAAGRAAMLERACGGDAELRQQVESLLQAHEAPGSFLDRPAVPPAQTVDAVAAAEGPGMRIGPYKLLQALGEGGMGTVYLAEQEEPVRRRVALKVIK